VYLLFDYLHLTFFSFIFYNKFVEFYKLCPCKTAYYVKRQKQFPNFLKEKFATFYGLDMELEPELFKSRNRNHNFKSRNLNHNFSKVGTGTVKTKLRFHNAVKMVTVVKEYISRGPSIFAVSQCRHALFTCCTCGKKDEEEREKDCVVKGEEQSSPNK
jgi:hypothetical protein